MKNILIWLWQLPQHVLALIMYIFFKLTNRVIYEDHDIYKPEIVIWLTTPVFGVSLGMYIFVGRQARENPYTVQHERGHSIQSRRFGLLYLFAVGIPSVIRNIRLPRQPGEWEDRQLWYYAGWPEKQADKLGGVKRTY